MERSYHRGDVRQGEGSSRRGENFRRRDGEDRWESPSEVEAKQVFYVSEHFKETGELTSSDWKFLHQEISQLTPDLRALKFAENVYNAHLMREEGPEEPEEYNKNLYAEAMTHLRNKERGTNPHFDLAAWSQNVIDQNSSLHQSFLKYKKILDYFSDNSYGDDHNLVDALKTYVYDRDVNLSLGTSLQSCLEHTQQYLDTAQIEGEHPLNVEVEIDKEALSEHISDNYALNPYY